MVCESQAVTQDTGGLADFTGGLSLAERIFPETQPEPDSQDMTVADVVKQANQAGNPFGTPPSRKTKTIENVAAVRFLAAPTSRILKTHVF